MSSSFGPPLCEKRVAKFRNKLNKVSLELPSGCEVVEYDSALKRDRLMNNQKAPPEKQRQADRLDQRIASRGEVHGYVTIACPNTHLTFCREILRHTILGCEGSVKMPDRVSSIDTLYQIFFIFDNNSGREVSQKAAHNRQILSKDFRIEI